MKRGMKRFIHVSYLTTHTWRSTVSYAFHTWRSYVFYIRFIHVSYAFHTLWLQHVKHVANCLRLLLRLLLKLLLLMSQRAGGMKRCIPMPTPQPARNKNERFIWNGMKRTGPNIPLNFESLMLDKLSTVFSPHLHYKHMGMHGLKYFVHAKTHGVNYHMKRNMKRWISMGMKRHPKQTPRATITNKVWNVGRKNKTTRGTFS